MKTSISQLQNQQYTGVNRCIPCTVVNCAIALCVSAFAAVIYTPLAVGTLVISGLAIWIQGYLVPGTPELTKRYLPSTIESYIKSGVANKFENNSKHDGDINIEEKLTQLEVVEVCEDGSDICLTESAEHEWRRLLTATSEVTEEDLSKIVPQDTESISIISRSHRVRVSVCSDMVCTQTKQTVN